MRFVVHESWGYLGSAGTSKRPPGVTVSVHDSLYLYRVAGTFRSEDYYGGRTVRAEACDFARNSAEVLAARLNDDAT